jgi:hypothetical protein
MFIVSVPLANRAYLAMHATSKPRSTIRQGADEKTGGDGRWWTRKQHLQDCHWNQNPKQLQLQLRRSWIGPYGSEIIQFFQVCWSIRK